MQRLTRREVSALLGAGLLAPLAAQARATDAKDTRDASSEDHNAQTHVIDIRRATFEPGTLTIKAGDHITWVNHDIAPHTATEMEGEWDTGALKRGETGTLTFDTEGTHAYYCVFHPHMTGKIVVTA